MVYRSLIKYIKIAFLGANLGMGGGMVWAGEWSGMLNLVVAAMLATSIYIHDIRHI